MITRTVAGALFADDVNRADDANPNPVPMDPIYAELEGDWGVVSNRLQSTGSGNATIQELFPDGPTQGCFFQADLVDASVQRPSVFARFRMAPGVDGYELRYDVLFGTLVLRRWNNGSVASLGGSIATGGTGSGNGTMQIYAADSVQRGRFRVSTNNWKAPASHTDATKNGVAGEACIRREALSGSPARVADNPIAMRDPFFRTTYAGAVAPGWKVEVRSSAPAQICVATNVAGVALPDAMTSNESVPIAGWHKLRLLDTANRPIDEFEGPIWPGEQFEWNGFARAYPPTLTNLTADLTLVAIVGITAMEHIEGVTIPENFGPDNNIPYPQFARFRWYLASAPTVVVAEYDVETAVDDLEAVFDDLAPGNYLVEGAWYDQKYGQIGCYSAKIAVTVAAVIDEPSDEEEGVTYNVTCDGSSWLVELEPWDGEEGEVEVGIFYQLGRQSEPGVWAGGRHLVVARDAGMRVRDFPILERGILNGLSWRRIISVGGEKRLTIEHRIACDAFDDVPVPFFETAPGGIYDADFELEWEYRGPTDFWTGQTYTHRVSHRAGVSGAFDLLEAAHSGLTFPIDFVAGLAAGWHFIEVITVSEDGIQSAPNYFAFKKGDPDDLVPGGDWKNEADMPAGAVPLWTGAGVGSDRTIWEHTPGVGITARRDALNPLDFQESVLKLPAFDKAQSMSGVLVQSERVRNEAWTGASDRFGPTCFQTNGLGFCVDGDGADKLSWHGILLQRESSWWHGWGWSGNLRAAGVSSSKGGVNMDFNRKNFGGMGPYVYAVHSNLASLLKVKRPSDSGQEQIGDGRYVSGTRWYPNNRASGMHAYSLIFELERVINGYQLRYMIAGPGSTPDGWGVEELVVSENAGEEDAIPCGFCALVFQGPFPEGEAAYHSLMAEVSLECLDCPDLEGAPEILDVIVDKEARSIRVKGNEPTPNDEETVVRYRLFIQGQYEEALGDSGWIPWEADGFLFEDLPVDAGCFVLEYAWADECGNLLTSPLRQASLPTTGAC